MSADLYIHTLNDQFGEAEHAAFNTNTLGSKHFNGLNPRRQNETDLHKRINTTPNVWVGSVSWLKEAFLSDGKGVSEFVPTTIKQIHEIVGEELEEIDEDKIQKVLKAFEALNSTRYDLEEVENVETFLRDNFGKRWFTVSW